MLQPCESHEGKQRWSVESSAFSEIGIHRILSAVTVLWTIG
jgi:hypothetical protein